MNTVILSGRLTKDPEIRYSAGEKPIGYARYTLAVDRPARKGSTEHGADYINCIAFGQKAEFAEKYLHKGIKIMISGHIQTGSYMNKEGQKVYTTNVVVNTLEFSERKEAFPFTPSIAPSDADSNVYMDVPDNFAEELPFS